MQAGEALLKEVPMEVDVEIGRSGLNSRRAYKNWVDEAS